jgi:hypothetical protein
MRTVTDLWLKYRNTATRTAMAVNGPVYAFAGSLITVGDFFAPFEPEFHPLPPARSQPQARLRLAGGSPLNDRSASPLRVASKALSYTSSIAR